MNASLRPSPRLAELFDRPVHAHELAEPIREFEVHPEEEPAIASARAKRRAEFSSGRVCARRALADLGLVGAPIPVGERRLPLWPNDLVGSITHTDGFCGAAVTRASTYIGLGVDAERLGRLKLDAERLICTDRERRWLDSLSPEEHHRMATILFSAKEAFYKCQFQLTRSWLGFRDAELEVVGDGFEIRLLDPEQLPRLGTERFRGRFLVDETHVYTGIAIEPS